MKLVVLIFIYAIINSEHTGMSNFKIRTDGLESGAIYYKGTKDKILHPLQ